MYTHLAYRWPSEAQYLAALAAAGWAALEIEPPAEMPVLGRMPPRTLSQHEAAIAAYVAAVAAA